jgi:hypothetical protein
MILWRSGAQMVRFGIPDTRQPREFVYGLLHPESRGKAQEEDVIARPADYVHAQPLADRRQGLFTSLLQSDQNLSLKPFGTAGAVGRGRRFRRRWGCRRAPQEGQGQKKLGILA